MTTKRQRINEAVVWTHLPTKAPKSALAVLEKSLAELRERIARLERALDVLHDSFAEYRRRREALRAGYAVFASQQDEPDTEAHDDTA